MIFHVNFLTVLTPLKPTGAQVRIFGFIDDAHMHQAVEIGEWLDHDFPFGIADNPDRQADGEYTPDAGCHHPRAS